MHESEEAYSTQGASRPAGKLGPQSLAILLWVEVRVGGGQRVKPQTPTHPVRNVGRPPRAKHVGAVTLDAVVTTTGSPEPTLIQLIYERYLTVDACSMIHRQGGKENRKNGG